MALRHRISPIGSPWWVYRRLLPSRASVDFVFNGGSGPQRQYMIGWTIPSIDEGFLFGQGFQNDQANRSPWAGVNPGTIGHELLHILGYDDPILQNFWAQFGANNTGDFSRLIRERCL